MLYDGIMLFIKIEPLLVSARIDHRNAFRKAVAQMWPEQH